MVRKGMTSLSFVPTSAPVNTHTWMTCLWQDGSMGWVGRRCRNRCSQLRRRMMWENFRGSCPKVLIYLQTFTGIIGWWVKYGRQPIGEECYLFPTTEHERKGLYCIVAIRLASPCDLIWRRKGKYHEWVSQDADLSPLLKLPYFSSHKWDICPCWSSNLGDSRQHWSGCWTCFWWTIVTFEARQLGSSSTTWYRTR